MTQPQPTPVTLSHAVGRIAPTLAGAAAVFMAIYQVARPGSETATYESFFDWLREGLFLTYLLASIATFVLATRSGLATRWPAALVTVGYSVIAMGVAFGMALRDDPDWFFILAGPGLLASTIGFVWFAVSAVQRRTLPAWAALLAGVGGALAILMSELGTSVLVGAFWLWIATTAGPWRSGDSIHGVGSGRSAIDGS